MTEQGGAAAAVLAPAAGAELIQRTERSPRLRTQGLHVHIGSQILEVEPFARSVAAVAALGAFPIDDLGGGRGARYTYGRQAAGRRRVPRRAVGAAHEHLPAEAELIIEPGRSMVASAATTLYRVVTVKRGKVTFVAVDGGMGDNLELALFGQRFEAGIVDRLDAADGETATLAGRHGESGDVLVDEVRLPAPRVGDLVGVPATGAYCFTMANNYNGTGRIPVASVADGEAGSWCVARRGRTCSRATSTRRRDGVRTRRNEGFPARAGPAAQARRGDDGGNRDRHRPG